MRLTILLAMLLASPSIYAHALDQHVSDWVFWLLLMSLVAYLAGVFRGTTPGTTRLALFLAGWTLLAMALFGPVASWQQVSLAGHMVQHMTLIVLAPPLLLLARPMPQYMQVLPLALRRRIGPILGTVYRSAGETPVIAFVVHGLTLWLWHLPLPFQSTLVFKTLHDLEHGLFFATALWFWWSLMAPARLGRPGFGLATLLAVLTLMHTGMLGALMTFAPQLLYPEHPAGFAGLDQLSDQQLAGLLMWVVGGIFYSGASMILFTLWWRRSDKYATT